MSNYSVDGIAPFTYKGDTISITSFSGSTTLLPGVAQTLQIGTLNLTVGFSSSINGSQTFNTNRNITLNALTWTLLQDTTVSITPAFDKASVNNGGTTTFNVGGGFFVDVTPIAYTTVNLPTAGSSANDPINATFLLYSSSAAPEPSTLVLLPLGLACGALVRRRRG